MLHTIEAFLAAHPVVRGVLWMIAIAAAGSWVNWVTWKPTPEEWEAYQAAHPTRVKWLRISRAIFPHLRKIPALAPFLAPPPPSNPEGPKS